MALRKYVVRQTVLSLANLFENCEQEMEAERDSAIDVKLLVNVSMDSNYVLI